MLRHKLHFRGLSRLMAGLFAMQIIVTSVCMLSAQAHAMPASAMKHDAHVSYAASHCANTPSGHQASGHGCFHCDHPDEMSNGSFSSLVHVAVLLPGSISAPEARVWGHVTEQLSSRIPTGPPRSSTLLYTTSQRIRI
ncbi:hypothetical protein [Mariprofundus ferrooxydans]|uniref:hypothetical protein n=2 Tax=Mariprofundus ferrooxydans TaxID=314344 RepID=UPI0018C8CF2F|nr:hypothetical protein [Mariprofundus ferrooxydans]